jgi:acyl-CoA hydrolase
VIRAEIEAAMADRQYTKAGTAPRTLLRFLAAPTDVNWGGKVHLGIVMRWIDEAAHVLATQLTRSPLNVAVYAGGVRFYQPLRIGDLVEVEARLLLTGSTSMHISVHVRSGDPSAGSLQLTTHCLIIFVSLNENGDATRTRQWTPGNEHAAHLIQLREPLKTSESANADCTSLRPAGGRFRYLTGGTGSRAVCLVPVRGGSAR